MEQRWPRFSARVLGLGLLLLVVVAYLPTRHGDFIWDDDDHLTQNHAVQSPGGLRAIWTDLNISRYYPLTLTTFWLEYRAWGLQPGGYHAANVLLHGVNAILLWLLMRRLNVPYAWAGAALWAVHPVNVESVAWITELKNIQSTFFFLLAVGGWLKWQETRRVGWYVASLVGAAAAFLSKPSTVVLPAILVLLDWWGGRKGSRFRWWEFGPFFGLAAAMSLLTVIEQQGHIDRGARLDWTLGWLDRIGLAARAVWFYAAKVVWPSGLSFVYPRWDLVGQRGIGWSALGALAVLASVLFVLRHNRDARAAILGISCYVVALTPVLGVFDIFYFRYSYVADHFQYLASMGLVALGVATLCRLIRREEVRRLIAILLVALFICFTWSGTRRFHNNESLWTTTLATNPNCWLAHNNLAAWLVANGQESAAEPHFRDALRLAPHAHEIHLNLGVLAMNGGNLTAALDHLRRAVEVVPKLWEPHQIYALALAKAGRPAEAAEEYRTAIELSPREVRPHNGLAELYEQLGRLDSAREQYRRSLQMDPWQPSAHYNLANLLANTDAAAAERHYRACLQIDPSHVRAWTNLANLLLHQGDVRGAIEAYTQALQQDPNLLEALQNRAVALGANGDRVGARRDYESVLRLATSAHRDDIARAAKAGLAELSGP